MSYTYLKINSVEKQLDSICKRYPKDAENIRKTIGSLRARPSQGDAVPGFNGVVRKLRIALKSQKIGKRSGLRLWYLVNHEKRVLCPILIYRKGDYKKETQVLSAAKKSLKAVIDEIGNEWPSAN